MKTLSIESPFCYAADGPSTRRQSFRILHSALCIVHCAFCIALAAFATAANARPFLPEAAERPHVLFVNVAGALPEADFADVAEYAASRVQVNIWTNSIPASMVKELVGDPSALTNRFGPGCCAAVFIERNAKGYSFLNAQGSWSMVNLRGIDRGNPSAEVLRDRRAKMFLKGLAYACGSGSSLEPKCSLYYGSFTLEGMDKTGVQISPMSYFPMLETLRAIGGPEILSPPQPEE